MRRTTVGAALTAPVLALALIPPTSAGAAGSTLTRVSVSTSGAEADGQSERPSISSDGRYVAFTSRATNLVPDDTNGVTDVFVRDLVRKTTVRVSLAADGSQADGGSAIDPQISPDGRLVAFASDATNLVPGDTNGRIDIFLRNLKSGQTTRVSLADKRKQSDGDSMKPTFSADNRYIAFASVGGLVAADGNETWDSYVHDRQTGRTELLSVGPDGRAGNEMSDGPSISADGRFAVFISLASNLVPGDTNSFGDVFLRDRVRGRTTRISEGPNGESGDDLSVGGQITANNRYVALATHATNLTPDSPDTHDSHVLIYDRRDDTLRMIDNGLDGKPTDGGSFWTAINAYGTHLSFTSAGTTLVPGDTNGERDIFQYNLRTHKIIRISETPDGTQADHSSFYPSASADARRTAFISYASNLVPGDTNGVPDVFVRIER
jgi:Tol biopolymer transport system component